jgi:hypothetical protein
VTFTPSAPTKKLPEKPDRVGTERIGTTQKECNMELLLVTDSVRFGHLLAVCIGLGASIMADIYILNRLRMPLSPEMLATLHRTHLIVWAALGVMWATGLGLVYIRTGFDPATFTPKLIAKLATVSVLTVNAVLIGWVVMPILKRAPGKSIAALHRGEKLCLSVIGGISSASWMLALAMGVSKVLARSDADVFAILLPAAYLIALPATAVLLLSQPRPTRA